MSQQAKKIKLISILVALILALVPIMGWLVKMDRERNQAEVYLPFGSPEEIIAAILIVAIFIGIIVVAVSLQKVVDHVTPGIVDFPYLNAQQRIKANIADDFFHQPPPRRLDNSIFNAIWNGMLPSPVRILLWSMVPLMLGLLMLFIYMAMWMTENDRSLDKGPTRQVEAIVLSNQRKNSRSGTYYQIDYQYKQYQSGQYESRQNSRSIKGTSYADHSSLNKAALVQVEYLTNNPNISRIIGLRASAFDTSMAIVLVVLIGVIITPGLILFLYWRKGFARVLVTQGIMLEAQLEKVKKGAKGSVFARISFKLQGRSYSKKLICPAIQELYVVLSNRQQQKLSVLILVHPSRYRYAYLLEPHLA